HGANRLASNSLLEALVFGARVADDVRGTIAPRLGRASPPAPQHFAAEPPKILRETMSRHLGLERDDRGIRTALSTIRAVERAANGEPSLLNMAAAAKLVAAAAPARRESRGAHFRSDHPQTDKTIQRTTPTPADTNRIAEYQDAS